MRGILVAVACAVGMGGCGCSHKDIHGQADTDPAADTISDSMSDVEPSDMPFDPPATDCVVEPDVLGHWMIVIDHDHAVVPSHVAVGHDGRIIVSGTSDSIEHEDYLWLLEVDGAGTVIGQKIIEGVVNLSSSSISATPLGDCGLLLSGNTADFGPGGVNVWLARLDKEGTVLWQKAVGSTGNELDSGITETLDGGFLLAATSDSDSGWAGDTDVWLVKLNADATISWQRLIVGAGDERFYGPVNLVQAPDGVVYIAFTTQTLPPDVTSVLMSLDQDGRVLWQKRVAPEGDHEGSSQIASMVLDDDHILIAGSISSTTSGCVSAWAAKVTRAGSMVWQRAFDFGECAWMKKISVGIDGSYLVSGTMVIEEESGVRHDKLWIASLTPEGEISWQVFIGEWEAATGYSIDNWGGQAIHHFDGIVAVSEDVSHTIGTRPTAVIARLEIDGTFPGECSYIRAAETTSFEAEAVLVESDILVRETTGMTIDAYAVFRDVDLPALSLCPE